MRRCLDAPELQADTAAQSSRPSPEARAAAPGRCAQAAQSAGPGRARLAPGDGRNIAAGRLTVNNEVAHVGQRVQPGDQIKLDGKPVRIRIEAPTVRVLAYHKPAGEVVTTTTRKTAPPSFAACPTWGKANGNPWAAWT